MAATDANVVVSVVTAVDSLASGFTILKRNRALNVN